MQKCATLDPRRVTDEVAEIFDNLPTSRVIEIREPGRSLLAGGMAPAPQVRPRSARPCRRPRGRTRVAPRVRKQLAPAPIRAPFPRASNGITLWDGHIDDQIVAAVRRMHTARLKQRVAPSSRWLVIADCGMLMR